MSNLNGTYKSGNATLTISNANDSNGTFVGKLTESNVNYDVNGHYHFENSVGPNTVIAFIAKNDSSGYQARALFSKDLAFRTLKDAGGLSAFNGQVSNVQGEFIRV
ncbi:hypothetical protein [Dyella subtropica]|uniref:hypothetical protein n=1 Tax=Dyella subtropica TaxID=2992127 RepID=UPI0022575EF9|nr:hypothetical protein [Dyella subtropica]